MTAVLPQSGFFGSRSGRGFLGFVALAAVISGAVGYGFYSSSLASFKEHKSEEKITALRLVDSFVETYSELSGKISADMPVPATFRARSIELFGKVNGPSNDFRLRMVGRAGRSIATEPTDPELARTIETFASAPKPEARAEFVTIGGTLVFRTVYPSIAHQQSCVDCHNKIQPDQHWKLGDVMGAFSIDVPAGPVITASAFQGAGVGLALMLVLSGIGFVVTLMHRRQMTERETAQVSLKESEERFRDFAESASDWFWEQDDQLRFTFVSRGAPDQSVGNVLGKTRDDLIMVGQHSGLTSEQWESHREIVRARRPFQNLRFQRRDAVGQMRHISVSGRPILDAAGHFRGYRGTGRDVTSEVAVELELGRRVEERTAELHKAQSELLSKERLSILGQLTATVAHELRNPLSAIRNTVFAVKETASGAGLNLERPLTRVERNIQRCDRIITDLLDFTRLRELSRADVEADAWLDELLEEQRLPPGITLRRDLQAGAGKISFDPERMRRVIINLIENAAQAMAEPPNGERERTITVSTRVDGDELELAIEDTGPGISAEVLAKVFEPLFSTKTFGTGLGLPTVRQIIEQHGGTVAITSEIGTGTRVLIRLPAAAAKEMAA